MLCKSQSRFSRDIEVIEKYINNKFKEWNIRFISISDNIDTKNEDNFKTRQINALVNEWYLDDISKNIKTALHIKMKLGKFVAPFTVYGYKRDKNNKNKISIDTEASKIVKKIFNLYLDGYGYKSIGDILNKNNIPPPSIYKRNNNIKINIVSNNIKNIKWNSNTIKTILTNEIYIGNLIQGKRTTISYKNHKTRLKDKNEWIRKNNTHMPIIEKEKFIKVQEEIEKRKKRNYKAKTIHTFSNLIFCHECNSLMRKKTSNKHNYLVCSSSEKNKCCNKKAIRYDKLENIILDTINQYLEELYNIDILKNIDNNKLNESLNIQKNNIKKEIEKTNNKIEEIDNYIKELYEDKIKKIIPDDIFKNLLGRYIEEKNTYKSILKHLIIEKNKIIDIPIDIVFKKYESIDKLDTIITKTLIQKILVRKEQNNTREILIYWNF